KSIVVSATGYSTKQANLSTHTATGINLESNPMVIAVDPRVIPLGSIVEIPGYGTFIAGDTGGAIKGNKIDIHFSTVQQANNFGRKTITINILN
ncbi:MAG: 3D domain-containing protein, partial [Carnobacterium jeotgali]